MVCRLLFKSNLLIDINSRITDYQYV